VNDELHRIFLVGIKVRRLDEEALDFVVVGAGEPESFEGVMETRENTESLR
jgi:hypothetical protein